MEYWQSWKYKNLTLLFCSVVFAIWLSRFEAFHSFLLNLGNLGYIGAFIAGILFVSTFTVATGAVILLVLAEKLSPFEIGIIAGLGGVIGDFIIFRLIQDNLIDELRLLSDGIGVRRPIRAVLHSRYFAWFIPVLGALIIASPLPDEMGVSMMGISHMKRYQFLLITFILNAVGIFLVVSASRLI